MKVLYFDCASGISGNMTLGALMELCDDPEYLIEELKKIKVDGYHIHVSKEIKNGITGTYVDVHLTDHHHEHSHEDHHHEHSHEDHHHEHSHEDHHHEHSHEDHHHEHSHEDHHHEHSHEDHHHEHSHEDHHHEHSHEDHHHDHSHSHVHRNLYDVNQIIDASGIDEKAKELAKRIFLRVAMAESKVHNESLENVHFHEVGAIDSIVDIIGTAILVTHLNPDVIYSSVVNDGHGFINCAHGMISVPVPATTEIFAASDAITRQIDIDTELVTPTGAAIISELATEYLVQPAMNIKKIGWGCGTKNLKIPNVLKAVYGDIAAQDRGVVVMETNIDDCTGEIMSYTMERLFESGALDVFFTPIFMKKNRPAYRLSVTCPPDKVDLLKEIVFKETTTIGIRFRHEDRFVLKREIVEEDSPLGKVKIKKIYHQDEIYQYPEFEDVKRIAKETGIPIKEVFKIVID